MVISIDTLSPQKLKRGATQSFRFKVTILKALFPILFAAPEVLVLFFQNIFVYYYPAMIMFKRFTACFAMFAVAMAIGFSSPSFAEQIDHSKHAKEPLHNMEGIEEIPGTKPKKPANQIFRTKDIEMTRDGFFLDQAGNEVVIEDYRGKIVLMDFIYTSCRYGHCQYLNNKMKFISRKLLENVGKNVQLVSISFDPEIDSVEVMSEYSKKYEPDPRRWAFLTGGPGDVADLAERYNIIFRWDMKDDAYNHSMKTILLDREGNVVREYRGMGYKLQKVIDDIKIMLSGKTLEPMNNAIPSNPATGEKMDHEWR